MYKFLRIEADPTLWVLQDPIDVAQLTAPAQPVAVQVAHPLQGTMLLSGRAAASIALLGPQPVGWRPSGIMLPTAVLYLPSPAGPTHSNPGFTLPAGADLAKVQGDITAAMSAGTAVAVPIAGSGELVLNGAALSFAILCPAAAGGSVT
jgi:hypothetical protein